MTEVDPPIICPECDADIWRCVERGEYDEYLYFRTGEFGDTLTWDETEQYNQQRDSWFCINDHEAPPELQDELEERVTNA